MTRKTIWQSKVPVNFIVRILVRVFSRRHFSSFWERYVKHYKSSIRPKGVTNTPPTHHQRISYSLSLKSGQRIGWQSTNCRPMRRWDQILYLTLFAYKAKTFWHLPHIGAKSSQSLDNMIELDLGATDN